MTRRLCETLCQPCVKRDILCVKRDPVCVKRDLVCQPCSPTFFLAHQQPSLEHVVCLCIHTKQIYNTIHSIYIQIRIMCMSLFTYIDLCVRIFTHSIWPKTALGADARHVPAPAPASAPAPACQQNDIGMLDLKKRTIMCQKRPCICQKR